MSDKTEIRVRVVGSGPDDYWLVRVFDDERFDDVDHGGEAVWLVDGKLPESTFDPYDPHAGIYSICLTSGRDAAIPELEGFVRAANEMIARLRAEETQRAPVKPEPPRSAGWIGVDLDRTLAYYDDTIAQDAVGEPIPAMVGRVRRWIEEGHDVRILTARVSGEGLPGRDVRRAREAIKAWCLQHLGRELPVTCTKDAGLWMLCDDRAIQVEPNTGRRIGEPTQLEVPRG